MSESSPSLVFHKVEANIHPQDPVSNLGFKLPTMDNHVEIQLLRINAQQKLFQVKNLFSLDNQLLKKFFSSYKTYPQLKIDMQYLNESQKAIIIKKNNSIYFGEAANNQMEGRGILIHNQGRIYEGWFADNQKVKQGYQIYPTGNIYIGQFQRNQKHGKGVYFWFETSMKIVQGCCSTQYYKGDWWGGMPSGSGIHHRVTGDVYEGEFKNGLKHGKGFQKFPNGDVYKGNYVNGLPEGYGIYQWKDRSIYIGDFKHGLRHGVGVWKQKQTGNCEYYQGHYLLDKKSGYGIYVWSKDQYYKGQFFQDRRHGFGSLYTNNKLAYQGAWQNGNQNSQIKYKKRPLTIKMISKAKNKLLTENDIVVQRVKREPSVSLNKYSREASCQNLKSPKFKSTVKRSYAPRLSLNPEVSKLERYVPFGSRAGHRYCIPIDQYLTVNKGLTKR